METDLTLNPNPSRTPIQVLFPSRAPKCKERLATSTALVEENLPDFELHWPRAISPRDLKDPSDYLAGTDTERCQELVDFLHSPKERIAWFGRGGFGVTRILAQLKEALSSLPGLHPQEKRWMGYSDITALFGFCKSQGLEIQCIHGPMVCAYLDQPNREQLELALKGTPPQIKVRQSQLNDQSSCSIWGGNLAVLASMAGTPWLPTPSSEQIIFLEDVDEDPYRLDRFLTQLKDSGFFRETGKIFLGTFTGFKPEEAALAQVQKRCQELKLEIVGHLDAGHSEPHTPIFLDTLYRYDASTETLFAV